MCVCVCVCACVTIILQGKMTKEKLRNGILTFKRNMGLLLMVKLFGITFPLKITKKLDLIFYKSFKNIKELTIY